MHRIVFVAETKSTDIFCVLTAKNSKTLFRAFRMVQYYILIIFHNTYVVYGRLNWEIVR